MTSTNQLPFRSVIKIEGEDTFSYLQGLLTNSVTGVSGPTLKYAALLTPQGKIISEMIIHPSNNGVYLDLPADMVDSIVKRLRLFKLKAKVTIAPMEDLAVFVSSDVGSDDPRHASMPKRSIFEALSNCESDMSSYHATRIELGLPEQGFDFGDSDVFPADINMDLNSGVDFKKGCFVGQEVVSRMKRRGSARRRSLAFRFESKAPQSGTALQVGLDSIGEITSVCGRLAIARVRLDRLAKSLDLYGSAYSAEGIRAEIISPPWLNEQIEAVTSS